MNLLEILPSLGEPRGTSPVQWQCWGKSAQYIDWGGEENHIASCVFDRETALVYCLELFTGPDAVRWLNPEFREDFLKECQDKGLDPTEAHPGLAWTDQENPQIMLALLATINPESLNDPT